MGSAQFEIERQTENWGSWELLADFYSVLATVTCPNCVSREFIDYFSQLGMAAYRCSAALNPNQRAPFIGMTRLMLLQENWSNLPETREDERQERR